MKRIDDTTGERRTQRRGCPRCSRPTVHNRTKQTKPERDRLWRCAVCGDEHK
jgi:hypothetical protein